MALDEATAALVAQADGGLKLPGPTIEQVRQLRRAAAARSEGVAVADTRTVADSHAVAVTAFAVAGSDTSS